MSSAEQTINLPQLLVLTIIGFLAIRWYFSSRTPDRAAHNRSTGNTNRVNLAHVEQLLQMFPQLDRRTIMWELQRNGGNVAMITEKVLSGRTLETVCTRPALENGVVC
jgi:coupling of ubiquitin conjugation to ER degradation protein 1